MWSLVNVYSSLLEMGIESSLIYWKSWFSTVMLVYQVTFGVRAPSWFPSKVWSEMAQMWREDLGAKADPLRYGLLGIWLSFPWPPMETPNGNPQWKHMETMDIPSTPNGNHGLALVLFIFKFLNGEVFKRDGRIPAGRCDDKFGPCCFAVVRLREVDAVGRWLASILRVFSQGLVMKEKNGWEQLRVLFNVLVRIQFDRQVLVTQLLANSGDVDKISSVDPMIFSDKHP